MNGKILTKYVMLICGFISIMEGNVLFKNKAIVYADETLVKLEKSKKDITFEPYVSETMDRAINYLKKGYRGWSLWYLELILDKYEKKKDIVELEEVVETTGKVIDKYLTNKYLVHKLLQLAEAVYKEQKLETAVDILQEILEYADKEEAHPSLFRYHLWTCYNLSLKKTRSIEETHNELEKFYFEQDRINYTNAKKIFENIEEQIPKGESSLVKKIKEALIPTIKGIEQSSGL